MNAGTAGLLPGLGALQQDLGSAPSRRAAKLVFLHTHTHVCTHTHTERDKCACTRAHTSIPGYPRVVNI